MEVSSARSRLKLARKMALFIAVNWLFIAFVDPDPGGSLLETVGLGLFFGSMFGQTTLAACWAALGPGPLTFRLAGSIVWVSLFTFALMSNIGVHGGPPAAAAVMIGLCLLGQWTLLQFPLWGLVLSYGLNLRHMDDQDQDLGRHERQFSIGQLIIVTAIVGVFLGIGRAIVTLLDGRLNFTDPEAPIFVFLGVAAVVLTLPLALAALLESKALIGVGLVLLLTALMTFIEMPMLQTLHPGPGPNGGHFLAINMFSASTILVASAIVRTCGYRLSRTSRQGAV